MNMTHCAATGSISSVSGTAYDLHNNVPIGLVTDTSTDNGGRFDVTYSLRGPTGSRRAARFALFVFLFFPATKMCSVALFQTNLNQRWTNCSLSISDLGWFGKGPQNTFFVAHGPHTALPAYKVYLCGLHSHK